jgi:hypothetical protein
LEARLRGRVQIPKSTKIQWKISTFSCKKYNLFKGTKISLKIITLVVVWRILKASEEIRTERSLAGGPLVSPPQLKADTKKKLEKEKLVKKGSLDFKGTRVKKFLTKKNIAR